MEASETLSGTTQKIRDIWLYTSYILGRMYVTYVLCSHFFVHLTLVNNALFVITVRTWKFIAQHAKLPRDYNVNLVLVYPVNECMWECCVLHAELKITCGHRSITVQNLIWTEQSMICMVIVSGQKVLHQKEPEIKFSHSLEKRNTRREAIIKSVAWAFRLCWISNFSSSEIDCVSGVDCYLSLKFSAVFFWFSFVSFLLGLLWLCPRNLRSLR